MYSISTQVEKIKLASVQTFSVNSVAFFTFEY